jgi:hypothetical protein
MRNVEEFHRPFCRRLCRKYSALTESLSELGNDCANLASFAHSNFEAVFDANQGGAP